MTQAIKILACTLINNVAKFLVIQDLFGTFKDLLVKTIKRKKLLLTLVMKIAIFLKELPCSILKNLLLLN